LSLQHYHSFPTRRSSDLTSLFYSLLSYAQEVKNKKAFEALVTIDPYAAINPTPLKEYYRVCASKTILDVMIESGSFDPENIACFKEHGGKTTQELKKKQEKCIIS